MNYLEEIKNNRLSATNKAKADKFVASLDDVSKDVRELIASLETSGAKKLDKKVVEAISTLASIVEAVKTVTITNDEDVKTALKTIAVILKGMDVKPIVNVSKETIDLDPLLKAIENNKHVTPEKEDEDPLAGYKAQDINDDDPHTQYVGFVNAQGNWYIIENNDTTNSLRYVFGTTGYAQAFKDAKKHAYKLYSEAVHEV